MACRHVHVTLSLEMETVELLDQLKELKGKGWPKSRYVNAIVKRSALRDLRRERDRQEEGL